MTDAAEPPVHYRVVYSERVRDGIRDLLNQAQANGRGPALAAALQQVDDRLRLYPQFGEPLRDLARKPGQIWLATVPPFVFRYVLDDERRTVNVVEPLQLLPRSGY